MNTERIQNATENENNRRFESHCERAKKKKKKNKESERRDKVV